MNSFIQHMRGKIAVPITCLLLLLMILPNACTHDPYARGLGSRYGNYERYEPSVEQLARMRKLGRYDDDPIAASQVGYTVADIDVVNYTDHVKAILRTKFTNARFARYTSSTAQVLLAAGSGLAATFTAGMAITASLGFGSAAVPQIGDIFNAKGRAGIYQDAVSKIEDAESAYYKKHSTPSTTQITEEGRVLYDAVTSNIHLVEKGILGELPDLKKVEKANGASKKTDTSDTSE